MISRLQVQGGSDGSVELMVLEQELARVHGARGKRRGVSPEAAAHPLERTSARGDSTIPSVSVKTCNHQRVTLERRAK